MDNFKDFLDKTGEVGFVDQIQHAIVYVSGLPRARSGEVVLFETGEVGQVLSLTSEYVEVLLLSKSKIDVGTRVARTQKQLEIGVGDNLLGKSIDPLGNITQNLAFKKSEAVKSPSAPGPVEKESTFSELENIPSELRSIEVVPLGIKERRNISKAFETGVTLVDLVVPLGMGQRELVVGDRKTGKTQFLLQSVYTQALKGTVCVYAAIAKKRMDIDMIERFIKDRGIESKAVVVASGSSAPAGLVFLTPYTAMTIAEFFRDKGHNVLVILDDLSAHAKYYREITLLARRFPGRSSYPGDIFYIHSRLLERAGNYSFVTPKDAKVKEAKPESDGQEVSITCLPVAELALGDISGYIQTNLMAMTDGHIFFDTDLFNRGRRPAINTFLSVTRVGRQAQSNLMRDLNRQLTSFLVSLEKLREFLHFGAELSEETKRTLALGDRILAFFDQETLSIIPVNINVIIIGALWGGFWKTVSINNFKADMKNLIDFYQSDQKFRGEVDNLVSSSKNFKELVTVIRQSEELIFGRLRSKEGSK